MRRTALSPWQLAVPAVFVGAGLLFAATAQAAAGTDLRGGDSSDLVGLIRTEQERLAAADGRMQELRAVVDEATDDAADRDQGVATVRDSTAAVAAAVGMEAVRGPGLTITLDDAQPAILDEQTRATASNDDLVVHQQDVQSVVNALWAGGAEAVQLMDQRVVSTSAVRCVGTTLVLQGRIYPPPYTITAIGDGTALRTALAGSPGVRLYQQYADRYGLVYDLEDRDVVQVPAYTGSLDLRHADVAVPDGTSDGAPS